MQIVATYPPEFIIFTGFIVGLLIGSFLNVVIYRLPLQLKDTWQRDALEFLEQEAPDANKKFSVISPPSRCTNCEVLIKPWHNIPVISYLLLKGRCKNCRQKISLQYPTVEILCGLLSAIVVWHFGLTPQTCWALLFTWTLIALTGIDFNHQLLPDNLTLPLLWLGLFININGTFTTLHDAVIGAMAGYLSLWSVYWAFKLIRGKEGMGYGDFKLLAVIGGWVGWQLLPVVILLSSVIGALVGLTTIAFFDGQRDKPIPFGPYLAGAGWIALIWGDQIYGSYLSTL